MIPKIIHYCWFGNAPKPEIILRCISSWRSLCPDFKIIEWNENNFNIESSRFCYEAYKAKKWAFVSDYVRLKVLYEYGGVYLDTDCELIKKIDCFLKHKQLVLGYEGDVVFSSAVIFAEPKSIWIKTMLDFYEQKSFIDDKGKYFMVPNTDIFTKLSINNFAFSIGDTSIKGIDSFIFDTSYFCPYPNKMASTKESPESFDITENTYSIHYGTATWANKNLMFHIKHFFVNLFKILFGTSFYRKIKKKLYISKINKIKL